MVGEMPCRREGGSDGRRDGKRLTAAVVRIVLTFDRHILTMEYLSMPVISDVVDILNVPPD